MISIVVPAYNCVRSIQKCVDSICAQSISDWELILVDDGSNDGTDVLCDQIASKDDRIRVIHKQNGGVSSARNLGIDHAKGEYLMFCDSDDWADPEWCRILKQTVSVYPDSMCLCNYYRNTVDSETVNRADSIQSLDECLKKNDFYTLNHYELLGLPWNKIYRHDIIDAADIRFREDLSLGEDLIFNLDYLHALKGDIRVVDKPLYHYNLGNPDSLSAKYYPDLNHIYQILFKRIFEEMGVGSSQYQNYLRSYFYAFDHVFRNTYSEKNKNNLIKKTMSNIAAFHSDEFQLCRKSIRKNEINVMQYYGLKSNSFVIYWFAVISSEAISRYRRRKRN